MINGVKYDTDTAEFTVYATLPKRLWDFATASRGFFVFSNHTYGQMYTFRNKKNIWMVSVQGEYHGLAQDLNTYLIERRADVTNYFNKR